jgi:hypothetical protein
MKGITECNACGYVQSTPLHVYSCIPPFLSAWKNNLNNFTKIHLVLLSAVPRVFKWFKMTLCKEGLYFSATWRNHVWWSQTSVVILWHSHWCGATYHSSMWGVFMLYMTNHCIWWYMLYGELFYKVIHIHGKLFILWRVSVAPLIIVDSGSHRFIGSLNTCNYSELPPLQGFHSSQPIITLSYIMDTASGLYCCSLSLCLVFFSLWFSDWNLESGISDS